MNVLLGVDGRLFCRGSTPCASTDNTRPSRTIYMTLIQFLVRVLIGMGLYAPVFANAAAPLRIDAAVPLSSTKEETVIDVSGTYDGSQGVVFVSISAWRKDNNFPAARPKGTPGIVTVGQFKVSAPISASRETLVDSDRFVVTILRENGSTLLEQTFQWPPGWLPVMPVKPVAKHSGKAIVTWNSIKLPNMGEMFTEGRFGDLEALAAPWLNGPQYSATALPMINYFTSAMKSRMVYDDTLVTERRIDAWLRAYPKSDLARYTRVLWWRQAAFRLSRSTPDKATDKAIAAAYRRRIQSGDDVLMAMKTRSKSPASPLWHELHLQNAISLGKSQADIDAVFDAAVLAYPGYVALYNARASDWTGKLPPLDDGRGIAKQVSRLAQRLEKDSAAGWGKGAVALYYVHVEAGMPLQFDILANGMIDWPSQRQAFRDLTARYPVDFYLNEFAAFACRAGDRETYFNLRPTIADHINNYSWRSNSSIDLCDSRYLKSM